VTLAISVMLAGAAACSSEDAPPHHPLSTAVSSSSAGGAGTAGAGGAGGSSASGGAATGGGGAAVMLGAIALVDEPDTPCSPTKAMAVEIYAGADSPPALDRLARVGTRWMASGAAFPSGFVTFDNDGTGASPAPVKAADEDVDFAASEGTSIGRAGQKGTEIVYTRFDDQDATIAGPLTVAGVSPVNLSIGGDGEGGALVLWGEGGAMHARPVVDGVLAAAFEFGAGTLDTYFTGSVAGAGKGVFGAAWSSAVGTKHVSSFAKLGAGGPVAGVVPLTSTPIVHSIVKVVKTSLGYALLMQADFQPLTAVVVQVDADGALLGPGHRLLGTTVGFDLAAIGSGDGFAVVARRSSKEIQLRTFDANGLALTPWICLGGPSTDLFASGAVAGDGDGYAVIYRDDVTHGEMLLHVDKLGSL